MSDLESDADPERRTDPRFDAWPVERNDAFADVPVERATPRGRGETTGDVPDVDREDDGPDEVRWLGFAGRGGYAYGPFLYDSEDAAVYRGDLDHDEDRIVLDEDSRRDVGDDRSLGEHLEAIGEEHGWTWLSSFAREHLEDDSGVDGADRSSASTDDRSPASTDDRSPPATGEAPAELELRASEFQRRNLPDSSELALGFSASHTLVDEGGRVHVIERSFDVADLGDASATVDVETDFLVATGEQADRRAGEAERVDRRHHSFDLEPDADAPDAGAAVESRLRTWHAAHVGWPVHA